MDDYLDAAPAGYLDAASSEPLHPAARAALAWAMQEGWADPARLYGVARRQRLHLDQARASIAEDLGVRADEVFFTPSGTAAVHLGVLGLARARARTSGHLVASAVEHSSVLQAAALHERNGGTFREVPVDREGRVSPVEFGAALAEDTAVACLQTANHEVGTLQPVTEVAVRCRELGVPLFVDACQSAGRLPLPEGWSVLAASAHKWGGPPGVGVLVIRKGVRWRSPLPADERGYGRVPGFENVPAIVAAAAALRARSEEEPEGSVRLARLVDKIRAEIPRLIPDVEVVGSAAMRLPHIVTFSCLYVEGEALLLELDKAGFAVSSGSSCTASTLRPSHVLEAMGVITHGNVRVSLPRGTPAEDVDRFLAVVPEIVSRLRQSTGVPQ